MDDSTCASPTRASAYIYGLAERVDHYKSSREVEESSRETARRQEILRPVIYDSQPITLVRSPTGLHIQLIQTPGWPWLPRTALSQHDATPQITRRHAQLRREGRL